MIKILKTCGIDNCLNPKHFKLEKYVLQKYGEDTDTNENSDICMETPLLSAILSNDVPLNDQQNSGFNDISPHEDLETGLNTYTSLHEICENGGIVLENGEIAGKMPVFLKKIKF